MFEELCSLCRRGANRVNDYGGENGGVETVGLLLFLGGEDKLNGDSFSPPSARI
jgi:hypothetical protein